MLAAAALLVVAGLWTRPAAAQPAAPEQPIRPAVSPQLAARLRAPYNAAVVDKPLRQMLTDIRDIAEFNLHLDRRVDPSTPVSIAAGRTTVFEAVRLAAASAGLAAVAAENVVIVGREDWVNPLAGAILAGPPAPAGPRDRRGGTQVIDVRWPRLTTPDEALALVAQLDSGGDDGRLPPAETLPHDLWPETSWTGIAPHIAALLITAQFDLMPATAGPQGVARQWVPLAAPQRIVRSYPQGPHIPELRRAVTEADPNAAMRTARTPGRAGGGSLDVSGSVSAHAAAIVAYLSHLKASTAASDPTAARFTLRLRDAVAKDVFAQLAGTAGRKLEIAPEAAEACRRNRVTLSAENITLEELAGKIAEEIGVVARWTDDALEITAR